MRILGIETEFALHFAPERPGDTVPTHEVIFRALAAALKDRFRSCEALYHKGGDFLENGSLVHFESGNPDDPTMGLLEWATPECLSPRELVAYSKAQERALVRAIPDAERLLSLRGYRGRVVVLKNNRDRFGNDYGTHESYDTAERPLPAAARILRRATHWAGTLTLTLPTRAVLFFVPLTLEVIGIFLRGVARFRPLRRASFAVGWAIAAVAVYLLEPGRRPGSGVVPRILRHLLRAIGAVYSLAATAFLFRGHVRALVPFLATRQVFAGSGHLTSAGRYELSTRASAVRRVAGAYVHGPMRPMIDWKEFLSDFFRDGPALALAPRKRLQLLVGDANRSEYAERLKLATTAAVLDAIEAGALDGVARRVQLLAGPIGALRATARDPGLTRPVARDRETGAALTALDVQRRYLEAVWEHARARPEPLDDETREALARWGFVLDQLGHDPLALDRELDWVVKKRLLDRTLEDALPGLPLDEGWARLAAFGALNALVEARAPGLSLETGLDEAKVAERLEALLGRAAVARAKAGLAPALSLADYPAVRAAWRRLKTVDLGYHEVSVQGGFYDWLERDGLVARELSEEELDRAASEPPPRTRARIRADFVRRAGSYRACRVGWDRVVFEPRGGAGEQTIALADPYRFELPS